MLIKIDDSVIPFIKEHELTSESPEIIAINYLATASREGHHVLIGSIACLEFIKNNSIFDLRTRKTFSLLVQKYVFSGAYLEFCEDYILVKGDIHDIIKTKSSEKCIYEVPLSYFDKTTKIMPTFLLSEDMSDCEFYVLLARRYIESNRDKYNFLLNFEKDPGGGIKLF